MKKVGIITINDYKNYGNRLQNYATQEVIKSLGFSVQTIVNKPNDSVKQSKVKRIINITNNLKGMHYTDFYNKVNNKLLDITLSKYKAQRVETFKQFTTKYLSETPYEISESNIPKNLNEEFDYYITGSDQIWNPYFRNGSSIDFLHFAPKDKRIAYAPSFGISEIPKDYIDSYKIWISGIGSLSVREAAGAKIIKKLTGNDALVVVDPTLMLTKDQWLSISTSPLNKPETKYLLTYFLGVKSRYIDKKINKIAEENNLKIINLVDLKDRETYIGGPSEFIDLINSASVFCTDSFHGVIFSILMETPFIIFERSGNIPSMNSRIETLLNTFKLESRLSSNIQSNKQIFDVDYSHIPPILEEERKKSLEFLKKSLKVKEAHNLV